MTSDPFFSNGPDSNWNACIGRQGDEESYADGFMQAALELVASLFEKEQYDKRDTLVYPILYTARHGIELSLKMSIRHLIDFGIIAEEHAKNHDILSHWNHLNKARLGDEALREIMAKLKPYVDSLSQIDEDGQELRYHENRDGRQSLANHGVTSLIIIRESLWKLSEILTALKHRILEIREERSGGLFTADCSRQDLMNIAGMLPPLSEWNTDAFTISKDNIKHRYSLGSNKFSDALNQIKKSREAKQILGQETALVFLTDKKILYVMGAFFRENPPKRNEDQLNVITLGELDFAAIFADRPRKTQLYQDLLENLNLEEIADFTIIFYLGRNGELSETYERRLEQEVARLKRNGEFQAAFLHVFTKTNFAREFENGLRRLGRRSLADDLARLSGSI